VDITNLKTIHKLLFVKKFKDYIYKSKFITSNQKNIDINLKKWDLLSPNLKYKFTEITKSFNNLDSVYTYWIDQINEKFSLLELTDILNHFNSEVGAKQAIIIDNQISFHVQSSFSFTGIIKDFPIIHNEKLLMQKAWREEDEKMRFDINKKENIQGQEFALSPLGKEYFITAILNVSGNISDLINRCLKKLV
jgi:hypothetical protein